jgi:hypothetical protein
MAGRLVSLLVVGMCGVLSTNCTQQQPLRKDAKPAPTSVDAIPEAPLSGSIHGQGFTVRSATYVVDRRPGYEHVDIRLSAAEAVEPCNEKTTATATSVWLRRKSAGELKATQARIAPNDGAVWEVHYQAQVDGRWLGNGDACALIAVKTVAADLKAHGELWACFSDEFESCVSGTFVASYCPIVIDAPIRGIESMERPSAQAMASAHAAASAEATPASSASVGSRAPGATPVASSHSGTPNGAPQPK